MPEIAMVPLVIIWIAPISPDSVMIEPQSNSPTLGEPTRGWIERALLYKAFPPGLQVGPWLESKPVHE